MSRFGAALREWVLIVLPLGFPSFHHNSAVPLCSPNPELDAYMAVVSL